MRECSARLPGPALAKAPLRTAPGALRGRSAEGSPRDTELQLNRLGFREAAPATFRACLAGEAGSPAENTAESAP
jgi:hypothetical protein